MGLLVAGITGGANLIKQAQMRSVIVELDKLRVGYNGYYARFGVLPGVGKNAYIPDLDAIPTILRNPFSFVEMAANGFIDKIVAVGTVTGSSSYDYYDVMVQSKFNKSYWRMGSVGDSYFRGYGVYKIITENGYGGRDKWGYIADNMYYIPAVAIGEINLYGNYNNGVRDKLFYSFGGKDYASCGVSINNNNAVIDSSKSCFSDIESKPLDINKAMFDMGEAKYIDDKIDDGEPINGKVLVFSTDTSKTQKIYSPTTYYDANTYNKFNLDDKTRDLYLIMFLDSTSVK